ncbi:hypothetical protein N7462_000750 [Penicillium macrosclerotiorum]|uniref:uncharacterized protein n=1 Tax=Penicillium macrosclerotiorum TaxID=303699 RepID=UPI0025468A42|nr:uncharacterized protein N7462_000750 [Penicillium macrosclerotiorum]KAJ5698745.1 hypothetical protein N7462_000750 [Penicillium macrosclerotiorum]
MTEFRIEDELLPHIYDHYAKVRPNQLYAQYPKSPTGYNEGFRPVTFRDMANAINGIAWWLTSTLGPGKGEPLAYIGPNDLRYPALVLGAVKAGYCMFYPSPRNSLAAQKSLLQNLRCTKFLTPVPRPPAATEILETLPLDVYDVPSVEDLLAEKHPHFEYSKSHPTDISDPMVIIHTSGSTGIPKPIIWRLGMANAHIRATRLKAPDGLECQFRWPAGKQQFVPFPPFHAGGIGIALFIAPAVDVTFITPPAIGLPTAAGLVEARKRLPMETAMLMPSMLQELAQNPELLDYCSQHFEFFAYMGGALPQVVGDTVAAKIKLVNQFGASEILLLSHVYSPENRDPLKDWAYVQMHPDLGAEFREVADGQYELVLVRKPELEAHQSQFTVFPEMQEYPTRDLFVRHPDPAKSQLWAWSSRADDIIVFLNGEKTNPVSMEQHITSVNPGVTGVLVAGAQRFQASLIVEYGKESLDPSERAAVIEKIWPSIEEANRVCPAHARIARTHILLTTPEKPMLRAGKGTIQRAGTVAIYAQELEALYADADRLAVQAEGESDGPGRVEDATKVSDFIKRCFKNITEWDDDKIQAADNFFHLGLDSLQAITAARALKRGFDLPSFTTNLIYLHPSLSGLTKATLQLMQDDQTSQAAIKDAQLQERNNLLKEFQDQMNGPRVNATSHATSHTVLLTGSTGTLGAYILDALLKHPSVAHVHCLNRRVDSREIQLQKNRFYHLDTKLHPSQVTFWHVNLSQKGLGLSSDNLNLLQQSATVIIHNAWNVNFNLSLPSFTPDLSSIVHLVNFAASSPKSPNLFFLSSISSVMGYRTESSLTPEAIIKTDSPGLNGYANSKYIAEQLLDYASKTRGIRASIARVAQVAGAVRNPGLWNKAEWFPSLVKSSLQIGAVPENIGTTLDRIDWTPIDLLSEVLVDIALHEKAPGQVHTYHPSNLHPKSWTEIIQVVANELSLLSGKTVEGIPLQEWVRRVRQDIETAGGSQNSVGDRELQQLLDRNPAAKLLEFFDGLGTAPPDNILDTQNAAKESEKLRTIQGIKEEWVRKWIGEWM